ncbi:MAG: methyltransferase domain-containing protein [Methanomicrobiaceae archaeon]|nr:methyltransferase domain-containing protein [Methanomicrobiaceae archaeon]
MEGWNPSDYHTHSSAQEAWAQELFPKLGLTGSERLLDLGCGDGKVTAALSRRIPDGVVIGLDRSPGMISFARSAYPEQQYRNLSFLQGDFTDPGFTNAFDVVFSNAALHWATDHRPVLEGIARALAPGGRCLLQMGGRGNAADILAAVEHVAGLKPWKKYFTGFSFPYGFYGPEEYREWLAAAGLAGGQCRLFEKDMIQPDAGGLAGWIRTTWHPYTKRVPEEKREEFIAAIVTSYLDRFPPDSQNRIHVRMMRLEVAAEKPDVWS